jgi:hypothetical protein
MNTNLIETNSLARQLMAELESFEKLQQTRFPVDDTLLIDLHCHDFNSDVPDELLGRILKVPETWLPTDVLLKTLVKHGCTAYTITNHNNARSIWELKEKNTDILSGAEFSCMVPEYNTGIHVLAYGFTAKDEKAMNKLRKNLYAFLEYTCQNDIPTIWAHPLYYYTTHENPPMDFYEKMSLVFERFEVHNGQRDTWQNMLIKLWVESLVPQKIDEWASKHGIDPGKYCRDPYKKSMSGGSDSHEGIFAGLTAIIRSSGGLQGQTRTPG